MRQTTGIEPAATPQVAPVAPCQFSNACDHVFRLGIKQRQAKSHMTTLLSKLTLGLAALIVSAGIATAQTAPAAPAPAPAAPKAAAPAPAAKAAEPAKAKGVPKKASTPEGIECSKQADEKKLHGKERKAFRAKCVRDLKKAAAAKGAAPAAAPAAPAPAKKN